MKNKLIIISLTQLTYFSQNCFAQLESESIENLHTVNPICVHPNQYDVFHIAGESTQLNVGFHPILYLNNEGKYGIDYTSVDNNQYQSWLIQCPEEYFLEAYLPSVNSRTVFKIIDRKKGEQFAPGASVNRVKNGSNNEYEVLSQAYDVLRKLAYNNTDEDVRYFLQSADNGYTINLTTLQDNKGSYVDFEEKWIQINLLELGMPYTTVAQLESEFTLQRLITHEVVHAAAQFGTSEAEVIKRTNLLLSDFEYIDAERVPDPTSMNDDLRYAFIQASPPPTPSQRFNAFFNRPTKEFVSDPFMWLSAIFSAPAFGGASMSLSRIATNIAKPRIPYQALGGTSVIPRANSVTSVNSLTAPIAGSTSSSIETASIETLSSSSIETASIETLASSSSIETASIETLESPSIDVDQDGPMSPIEQQAFVDKVDDELESLPLEPHEKMTMQFRLSPTAHYLNQAPDLARQFLRSEITVVDLYRQMPF